MRSKQPTIWDIAIKLNVSISTVSRALRNAPDINPDTKKAVLDLAHELDYQPNTIAASLRKNKTDIIGVLVPEFVHAYFPSVILGVQEVANAAGYKVMIGQSNESLEIEKHNLQAMLSSRVDGVIMAITRETNEYDHILAAQRKGLPVVFFNRIVDELPGSKVLVDDYRGAFRAVEHLIQTGCRRIAHLAGPENLTMSRNRLNGYMDALKAHQFPVDETIIMPCDFVEGKARACTQQLLDGPNRPDALFAVNDPTAIEALVCIQENGLAIPADISLAGFSNAPHSAFVTPPMTAVVQPTHEIGRVAARLLLRQIEEGATFVPETQTLDTTLVIRKSTHPVLNTV
ncbi:LacI family DNA-binding transcriptional regulator [Larkinella insperata]|uniref:LacI family DNA-binding transcriptional regulator n=1 Tax=Larkinella insperata TaxID=332158 RepID=A0ABW3QLL1_9BACT|nr:LacI family DNA-binding transcriptional regulator [Larkinella insperata]